MNEQETLFDVKEFDNWRKEWKDMPEFNQEDQKPYKSITVHFESREDMEKFATLIEQRLTFDTQSVWFPKPNNIKPAHYRYVDEL
jgi:hypothetical protein